MNVSKLLYIISLDVNKYMTVYMYHHRHQMKHCFLKLTLLNMILLALADNVDQDETAEILTLSSICARLTQ